MKTTFRYPQQSAELDAFVAENPNHVLWHDGAWIHVLTGDDIPTQPVPESVSRRQMREELIDRNMLDAAKATAKAAGPIMENYFLESTEYQRNHPKTVEAIALFGMTPEQGDDLFRKAGAR